MAAPLETHASACHAGPLAAEPGGGKSQTRLDSSHASLYTNLHAERSMITDLYIQVQRLSDLLIGIPRIDYDAGVVYTCRRRRSSAYHYTTSTSTGSQTLTTYCAAAIAALLCSASRLSSSLGTSL